MDFILIKYQRLTNYTLSQEQIENTRTISEILLAFDYENALSKYEQGINELNSK